MSPPLRVLCVDDDADIRTIVGLAFKLDVSIKAHIASSEQDLFAQLDMFMPDVCLLDVMMPNIGGLELLDRLRFLGLRTPVIFMTARVRAEDLALYENAGAVGVIAKPFDPLTLPALVRKLVKCSKTTSP